MPRARFLLPCVVLACLPALGRLFAPALRHELCAGLHSPAAGACALRAPDALCRLGAFSQPLVGAPGWGMAGGLTAHLRVHLSRQAGTWSSLKMTTSVLQSSPLAQLFNLFARKAAAAPAEKDGRTGRVVRCAAKGKPDPQIDPKEASAKSPAKPALHMLALSATGVAGDYNQYRSEVLRGDPARAVSILTVDVMQALRQEGWNALAEGELGENVLVSGVPYHFFAVGRQYMLGGSLVRITEPIQPCQYLCRLPWLRADRPLCLKFINTLLKRRGWYARVESAGNVAVGDSVLPVSA